MNELDRDPVVVRALQRVEVLEHAPDFWERLSSRLATLDAPAAPTTHDDDADGAGAADAESIPVVALERERRSVPSRRGWLLAVAAVLVLVLGVAALVATDDDDRVRVGPAAGPGSTSTTQASPRDPKGLPRSATVVLEFLEALANGDVAGAAMRMGPRSEAYIEATTGSVEDFLRQAAEGYGAWAAAADRSITTIEVRPGDVVVVLSGTITVEGAAERRHDAFPVRYAESAGAWFVEPWAFDRATGGRIQWLTPTGAGPHDEIRIAAPAEGTAWLSIDGATPVQATVGGDRTATWALPEPLRGPHLLVVAFVNDATFAALATSYNVDG